MALIPPFFIDTVVAIGKQVSDGTKNTTHWIGTGFLFGTFQEVDPHNAEQKKYIVHFVTNKHVFQNQDNIVIRFNPQNDQAATDYPIALKKADGNMAWTGHSDPEVDVAVLRINPQILIDAGMKFSFFLSDENILTQQNMIDNGISEGDFLYVLGFPLGLMPTDRQHVIVRSGIIARIRDLFENRSKTFTIDSSIFPGNSGGPVTIKPELVSITGTKAFNKAALIGIVKQYIPFIDIAISQQTGRARITFEENSGLAIVETVDKIIDTIALDIRKNTPVAAPPPSPVAAPLPPVIPSAPVIPPPARGGFKLPPTASPPTSN